MTAPATLVLHSQAQRQKAARWCMQAPWNSVVAFKAPKRTTPQNDRLHAMLTDIAGQVDYPLVGGKRRDTEAWKDIFTAALRSAGHDLDIVPGINGGFVLLGMHTSQMSKAEMTDLMTLIEAWCAENGVTLSEPHEPGEG